jgi:MFS family permease
MGHEVVAHEVVAHEIELGSITPASENYDPSQHVLQSTEMLRDVEPVANSLSRADYTFPEGGLKAWLVVFGSSCVICGTFGLTCAVGLFQSYWQEHQLSSYSSSDIGWIAAVNVFLLLVLGVQVGPLFDRYGPRELLAAGSVLYVLSLVLLAQCEKYWQFMLVFGIMTGVSSASLTTTALSVVAHYFQIKRGLASGFAFAGSSVGGIIFPLMLNPLFEHLSWAWSIRIVALVVAVMMGIGNICIRGRLPPKKHGGIIDLRSFKDARFSWSTAGIACKVCHVLISWYRGLTGVIGFEFTYFGSLGLLPTYSLGQGFSSQTSFNIIAILFA